MFLSVLCFKGYFSTLKLYRDIATRTKSKSKNLSMANVSSFILTIDRLEFGRAKKSKLEKASWEQESANNPLVYEC